jgi:hypothetical protein
MDMDYLLNTHRFSTSFRKNGYIIAGTAAAASSSSRSSRGTWSRGELVLIGFYGPLMWFLVIEIS